MRKPFVIKSRNLYPPKTGKAFKISRSQIELFVECQRCFWLNHKRGIRRPSGPPFTINSLVDRLLKKEFDEHRAAHTVPPILTENAIDAVPLDHPQMDEWRANFRGVTHLHESTGLLIAGALDDVWQCPNGQCHVVDYKATAKTGEVTLDADWQDGYKRQMEVYQWLLRKQGLDVSNTGYFLYCNGQDAERFGWQICFKPSVIPYVGDDTWIEPTLIKLKACLTNNKIPVPPEDCEFCGYVAAFADKRIMRRSAA